MQLCVAKTPREHYPFQLRAVMEGAFPNILNAFRDHYFFNARATEAAKLNLLKTLRENNVVQLQTVSKSKHSD